MQGSVCKCTCICVHICVYMHVCKRVFMSTYVFGCMLQRCRLVRTKDPIRIYTHYGPDTLAIRGSIYEMIWRFIPIHAVKIRRRFRFKTVSFHMSVCSYIISLFTVVSRHICVTRIISCDRLIYFTRMITCVPS